MILISYKIFCLTTSKHNPIKSMEGDICMYNISENLKRVIEAHGDEINNNQFEKVILDAYLQGGEACLMELKNLFEATKSNSGFDMKPYNRAIERIIKALLKNSDLLD